MHFIGFITTGSTLPTDKMLILTPHCISFSLSVCSPGKPESKRPPQTFSTSLTLRGTMPRLQHFISTGRPGCLITPAERKIEAYWNSVGDVCSHVLILNQTRADSMCPCCLSPIWSKLNSIVVFSTYRSRVVHMELSVVQWSVRTLSRLSPNHIRALFTLPFGINYLHVHTLKPVTFHKQSVTW